MSAAPARRALLIGITDYTHVKPLLGCVNDVRQMRAVLEENFGFPSASITLLENAAATRQGILDAWDALIDATGTDDIVVIHYAGHGSQMTDENFEESGGLDSTIVPIDSEGWQGDNRDISDDEIAARLEALGARTRFITLIMDCCHSGTITRDVFGSRGRSAPADLRPPKARKPRAAPRLTAARGPSGWLPVTEKYVVISGCRDSEISEEYGFSDTGSVVHHGGLSHALLGELRKAVPGTTYRDIFERAAAAFTALSATQHPQLEGRADREIFGMRDIVPTRFLRVSARSGGTLTLGAGLAQGLTVGSRYAIHPQGTKDPGAAPALGEAEITALAATTAEARIVAEATADTIGADARAFETLHAFGDFKLAVAVHLSVEATDSAPLLAALEASPLLKRVTEEAHAAAVIRLLPARATVAPDDPVAWAGALAEPMWAVSGEDGNLLMPLKSRAEIATVRTNLEKRARYRHALALDNPDPASKMRGRFVLDLLRQDASGKWITAEPELAGGYVVYHEGDTIGFRIGSTHDAPAQLALLDFGLSGAITPLRPSRTSATAQEVIAPQVIYEIGPSFAKPPTVTWPKELPGALRPNDDGPQEGLAAVKLFVTEQQADFTVLAQEGVRSASLTRVSTPAGDLIHAALQGGAPSDPGRAHDEDWTTVTRPYLVRRTAR